MNLFQFMDAHPFLTFLIVFLICDCVDSVGRSICGRSQPWEEEDE